MALKRLESVNRKMERDEDYVEEYRKKIKHYIEKKYARKLSNDEAAKISNRTFYLPHFAVKYPNNKG